MIGTVRAELQAILERFDEADRRMCRAQVLGDRAAADVAEDERREAMGDRYAAGLALADLWLLLTRHALEYRADAARQLLADVLGEEFDAIAEALERGRR
jgi:hypothetical protein